MQTVEKSELKRAQIYGQPASGRLNETECRGGYIYRNRFYTMGSVGVGPIVYEMNELQTLTEVNEQ